MSTASLSAHSIDLGLAFFQGRFTARKVAWVQSPKLGGRPASENSSNAAKEGLGWLGIRLT